MRPKEFVSGSRTVRFGAPGVAKLWPQRLIFRGGSWDGLTGCLIVCLSPLFGCFMLLVGIALHGNDGSGPPPIRGILLFGLLGGPPLIALAWWVWEALSEGRRGQFEVIVEPAASPGIIGETFKARIEVRMHDEPTSFRVRLARGGGEKGDLAWVHTVRPSISSVGRPADDRYSFTVEIPVPPLKKKPGREWILSFEARCKRWFTAYHAAFCVRMNDDEMDLPPLGPLPAHARDPL